MLKFIKEFYIIDVLTMDRVRTKEGILIPPLLTSYEASNIILELENSENYRILEVQGFKKYE